MAVSDKRNAYTVLGLHKGATEDQIKQAYVNLVKKYDPEVHTERFMIIQNAFNRLKEPERRAREDILTFNLVPGEYMFSEDERVEVPDEKLTQAIPVLEQKKAAEPASADQVNAKLIQVYFLRSWKNIQKKMLQEAMDDWRRALELDPTHQRAKNNLMCAYCRLGYSYANHTLYDEAIDLWEKAAQMNPDNHLIVHNLSLAYENSGQFEKALRYWQETLQRWKVIYNRNPDDEYLKTCIIEAHRHQGEVGKPDAAQEALMASEAARNDAQARGVGGASSPAPAPTPSPTRPATTPLPPTRSSPARPGATPPPPTRSQSPGQPSTPTPPPPQRNELQQHLEILKLKPDDFDANIRVAHLLIEQKKWPEAVTHLTEIGKKFPRNLDVLNMLGWAMLNNREVDRAFDIWNRAYKLDPKNHQIRETLIKAHMSMGRALREKNLFIKSLGHFKALAKFMPDSDEVHFELGETYKVYGDLRSAYVEYQTVVKLNPKHKQARTAMSELKMRRA